MNRFASLGLAVAVMVLAGCSADASEPDASEPDASVSAEPSALPSDAAATAQPITDVLNGGRYLFQPLAEAPSLTIEATGPVGWVGYPSWAMDGPEPLRADAPDGIGITFFSATGLFSDPCHWDVDDSQDSGEPGDVEIGPTVNDLVAGLQANTFYTSTEPTPTTIDGYAGQQIEIQLPAEPDYTTCDKDDPNDSGGHVFVFSGTGLYAQGQANIWDLFILDVDGTRLISVILSYAATPQADLDTAQDVIDTLDITP